MGLFPVRGMVTSVFKPDSVVKTPIFPE
jgi:hypothetical protein